MTDRDRELISRWLYNVEAVKQLAGPQVAAPHEPAPSPETNLDPTTGQHVLFYPQPQDDQYHQSEYDEYELMAPQPEPRNGGHGQGAHHQGHAQPELCPPGNVGNEQRASNQNHPQPQWWNSATLIPQRLRVGDFIGQGRKMQFCGLPLAFMNATKHGVNPDSNEVEPTNFSAPVNFALIAQNMAASLTHWRKPGAWYGTAVTSLALVWCAILSAFVVSYRSPTVGIGCRSLGYLLFGACSSVPWVIQLWKWPGTWARCISYIFNALAFLALVAVVVFQVRMF